MNKVRREFLKMALGLVDDAIAIITKVRDEEQDCLDNMPENLADSERCEKMESAIDHLEDAETELENAKEAITEAIA